MKNISKFRYIIESIRTIIELVLVIIFSVGIIFIFIVLAFPQSLEGDIIGIIIFTGVSTILALIFIDRKNLVKGRLKYFFLADPEYVIKKMEAANLERNKAKEEIRNILENEKIKRQASTLNLNELRSITTKFFIIPLLVVGIFYPVYYWAPGIYYGYVDKVSGSDVTVFPITCSNPAENIDTCKNPVAKSRIAYKIEVSEGKVITWNSDDKILNSPIGYRALNNCGIVDANNWS